MSINLLPENIILKISKEGMSFTKKDSVVEVPLPFTRNQLHEQFKKIDFSNYYKNIGGKYARDENVEKLKMPPFAFLFYFLLCSRGVVPTPKLLCDIYIKSYCVKKGDSDYSIKPEYTDNPNVIFTESSIQGRICRSYNSFNRELELLFQLIEVSPDDFEVYYSVQDDFYRGVDICIVKDNVFYGVASYMYSNYSNKYRLLKEKYRQAYEDIVLIPVIAVFENNKDGLESNIVNYGDIKTYKDGTAQQIIDTILGKSKDFDVKVFEKDVICPSCGSIMKKRVAKQGKYQGREFYGCGSYPKCTHIINI
jgi:hypothetical protein